MKNNDFAPWEYSPGYLRQFETQNPLLVLTKSYNSEWTPHFNKYFKELKPYGFLGEDNHTIDDGPISEAYVCDHNSILIESAYMLFLSNDHNGKMLSIPTDQQLQKERATWLYFPKKNSTAELKNPYLAIESVFKQLSPFAMHGILYKFFNDKLNNRTPNPEEDPISPVRFYESITKLYSAFWVISQRNSKNPYLKIPIKKNVQTKSDRLKRSFFSKGSFHETYFTNTISQIEQMILDELIRIITREIPAISMMSYLGKYSKVFAYFLLVIIDDKNSSSCIEVANKIENLCNKRVPVLVLVHFGKDFKTGISVGRRFFINALKNGIIVYRSQDYQMADLPILAQNIIRIEANMDWLHWGSKAKDYLQSVEFNFEKENYGTAAFHLHQLAKNTLVQIIKVICGYNTDTNDLLKLLKITLIATNELFKIYESDQTDSNFIVILQNGYVKYMVKSVYRPERHIIENAIKKVGKLIDTAEGLYKEFLSTLNVGR
ncbi:HEPN domain-containing protein [Mucilaginibacter sp. AW1-7]|uniref:HEPN domain-containing protein n=1 Tax=Mucilaginibacter sp. AW1-7 TaxID=3349874 RepID=UPI003F73E9EC